MTQVELPIVRGCELLTNHKTIGDVKRSYPKLKFTHYIYRDPEYKKLKGSTPTNKLPLVPNFRVVRNVYI